MDALWKMDLEILNLIVILRTSDGYMVKHVEVLPDFTYSYSILLKALRNSFLKLFQPGVSYCAAHLMGEPVRSVVLKQLNLFDLINPIDDKLVKLKRELNAKFGVFTVRPASTAFAASVFKDEASCFEISDIDGKFCF